MDKDTRNAIERATQRARKLLEEDFAAQLEGDFDVHRSGRVAAKAGSHLSARQAFQREKIVAAIEHKRAAEMGASEAVSDYLRDAAFTTLNRFVALKMLEARELVLQCITKGEQSPGYREFCGMAPGLPLLPDSAGYRLYIESLFDELSTEVKVLFDRRDPSSVLWPKRATFEGLLEILNASELAGVWGEDETIGWVYQFFNGADERKRMREESPAPRNSRELAVRNQFFTPRYVVQFLTDNTLGRIWYEMHSKKTALAERCEYMVRQPDEAFAPRAKKDPRDLRVLDPACGSGHFLLYAFDLLLTIYEEAHADPESPRSEATGKTLADDCATLEDLRKAAPGFILSRNLHGVDIDPRCAQIAQLALWMRAQRAYRDLGIARAERPQIRRSNIVVAEPLVADERLVAEFVARLGEAELGRVFTGLVDALKLAGDLGLLLRVETLVARPTQQGQTGNLFAPPEERIRTALGRFVAEQVERVGTRTRLFAADTIQGLGLAELAKHRYDVVLMNPPFGEATEGAERSLDATYSKAKGNLYIAFLYRASELLAPGGLSGAITDATLIHQTRYEELRADLLDPAKLSIQMLVANGWGVLDAYVETACLILSRRATATLVAMDVRDAGDGRAELIRQVVEQARLGLVHDRLRITSRTAFLKLPKKVLTFWLPAQLLTLYAAQPSMAPTRVDARCGMSSSDNPRFYKLRWEVNPADIGVARRWRFLANGGPPCPLFRQQAYVVNWHASGREVKAQVAALYGSASRTIINESYYFRGGLTYGKRTASFTAQFMPAGQVFSNEGQAIFPNARDDEFGLLAYLNASCIAYLLNSIAGQHKEAGYVGSIPSPPDDFLRSPVVKSRMSRVYALLIRCASGIPESQAFTWPLSAVEGRDRSIRSVCAWTKRASDEVEQLFLENDVELERAIGFSDGLDRPWQRRRWRLSNILYGCEEGELESVVAGHLLSYLLGISFGRWQVGALEPSDSGQIDPMQGLVASPPGQLAASGDKRERILVSDQGHPNDIVTALENAQNLLGVHGVPFEELEIACKHLDALKQDIRSVAATRLFPAHIERYTRSRRKAPIYWQLAAPSGSYSVWLYLHAITQDTFFRVQNDYAAPKLAQEERRLEAMVREVRDKATAADRKMLAAQETFVEEMRAFLDEVKRVAPLWKPNLDDGVIINFAPLWRLVPQHKPWQKELKATWAALCDEKYDWTHLAMHLWPDRVVPKCAVDRSLAIAHGLEDVFWIEDDDGKWTSRKAPTRPIEELVRERTSPAVKAALKNLLEAPLAANNGRSGRRRAVAGEGKRGSR